MRIQFILGSALLSSCALILGCASSGNPEIRREDLTSQIKIGESTKDDVRRLFGHPNGTSRYTGTVPQLPGHPTTPPGAFSEIWTYVHVSTEIAPVTFIPIVGLFAGNATSEVNQLAITFDDKGIVRGVRTGHTRATGGPGSSTPEQ